MIRKQSWKSATSPPHSACNKHLEVKHEYRGYVLVQSYGLGNTTRFLWPAGFGVSLHPWPLRQSVQPQMCPLLYRDGRWTKTVVGGGRRSFATRHTAELSKTGWRNAPKKPSSLTPLWCCWYLPEQIRHIFTTISIWNPMWKSALSVAGWNLEMVKIPHLSPAW